MLLFSIKMPYVSNTEGGVRHTLAERPQAPSLDLSNTYRPPADTSLPRASSPFLDKLATCDSLDCLKEAHMLPRGAAKFNHPHFLIIGFQKVC